MTEVLHSKFDVKILCLSIGISFIGAYVTICLCEQLRLSAIGHNRPKILNQDSLLGFMSFSLGGVGIWCMHFIGMSALQLETVDGLKVMLNFNILFTVISLVVVLCWTLLGLYVSSKDVIFRKSKSEIIEMFVESSKEMSFKEIQRLKNGSGIMFIICLQSLWRLAFGGAITGSGVVVMHYLGMSAIAFPGKIIWNYGIISASILIALVASAAAFWILFRLLSLYPQKEVLRVGSAVIMTIAVCGMHYTGMAAATFTYLPDHPSGSNPNTMSSDQAFYISFGTTMCFIMVLIILILADLRAWLYAVSNNPRRADDLVMKLKSARLNDTPALLTKYINAREIREAMENEQGRGLLMSSLVLDNNQHSTFSNASEESNRNNFSLHSKPPSFSMHSKRQYSSTRIHAAIDEQTPPTRIVTGAVSENSLHHCERQDSEYNTDNVESSQGIACRDMASNGVDDSYPQQSPSIRT